MAILFFDLDGTLTDPAEGIIGCLRHTFEMMGIKDVPDDLNWCIGPPLHESLATLLGPNRAGEAIAIYRAQFAKTGLYQNEVYQGMPALLADLNARGHSLYVATSKVKIFADRILEHFDLAQHFNHAFGSELDGTRSKKGDLLAFALKETGCRADDAFMIGDRKFDIIGAQANSIASIGVTWGYGSLNELQEAGAGKIVGSVAELGAFFG